MATLARPPAAKVRGPAPRGADPVSAEECQPSELSERLGRSDAEQLARAFAALGDPVRLRLLHLVSQAGEVCSCDLAVPLDKAQPTVSHHTSVLADAGLIVGDRRGRWVWWHVVPERLANLRSALDLMPIDGPADETDL